MPAIRPRRPGASSNHGILLLCLALAFTRASALSQQYCSNQNTGSDYSAVSNNFQSNGRCSTTCSGYAFAVVQYKSCWCSNYVPADTASSSSCGVACPGYPFESCGDASSGFYGYVALGPSPSGTKGSALSSTSVPASSTSTTAAIVQSTSSSDPGTVTVQDTVTASPSIQVSFISTTQSTTSSPPPQQSSSVAAPVPIDPPSTTTSSTTSTPTPTTSDPPTTSSASSIWTPIPITSVMTVTGLVKTLTITPTAPPAVETVVANKDQSGGGFFSNPGKVAGTFVAVAIILLLLAGALIWFFVRRKRRNDEVIPVPSNAGDDTPQRRPSRLSQMGLLSGSGTAASGEKTVPPIQTSGWGPGNTNSTEKSPADTLDRRSSYPRVVDQRLEPTALWNPIHDNGSHVSVRSFRDDQDYSRRMLRIANPDDG